MTWAINQAGKLEPNDVVSKGLLEFRRYDERFVDLAFRTLPKCQVLIDRVLDLDCCCSVPNCCDVLAQAAMVNTLRESFQVGLVYVHHSSFIQLQSVQANHHNLFGFV